MNCIKVKWKHPFPDEPVFMYIELDKDRWEVRKVEVFPDGRRGFASAAESFGGTGLGIRRRYKQGDVTTQLSREFGVSETVIRRIVNKTAYQNVV